MNKRLLATQLILITTLVFLACRGPVKHQDNATASAAMLSDVDGEKYLIDMKQSTIMWKGSMEIGSNSHSGYVNIVEGTLVADDDQLVGGVARMDMTSISDENHSNKSGLIQHIKGPDFFDVMMYPSSNIAISKTDGSADETLVTANLSIKGQAHEVKFPAKVELKEGILKASGRLVIDRTHWNIRYQSGKFFGNLKDKAISDSIEFEVSIVAKKTADAD